MDIARLEKLGFECGAGQVDYKGKNYGTFNRHGATLTADGEALLDSLESGPDVPAELPQPRKPGRPRKKDTDDESLGQALTDLGSE